MQPGDRSPGPLAWLLAFVSFVLPWAAAVLALIGFWQIAYGMTAGWWYVAAGGMLLVADILIDFLWAHPAVLGTDQPDLNLRTAQLTGRIVQVEEAIENGRGKARVGDTLWAIEGADAPRGTPVRIIAARGTVLEVEKV